LCEEEIFFKYGTAVGLYFLTGCRTNPGKISGSPTEAEEMIVIRPHHLTDILSNYGRGSKFDVPARSGQQMHIVAPAILSNIDIKAKFVVGADDICKGCKFLNDKGECTRVKASGLVLQTYNITVDNKILDYLGIKENAVMPVREFLLKVNDHLPGIETVCTHPGEDPKERKETIEKALRKLEIRK